MKKPQTKSHRLQFNQVRLAALTVPQSVHSAVDQSLRTFRAGPSGQGILDPIDEGALGSEPRSLSVLTLQLLGAPTFGSQRSQALAVNSLLDPAAVDHSSVPSAPLAGTETRSLDVNAGLPASAGDAFQGLSVQSVPNLNWGRASDLPTVITPPSPEQFALDPLASSRANDLSGLAPISIGQSTDSTGTPTIDLAQESDAPGSG